MSKLHTIRTMEELEQQRALLQKQAAREEQQLRRDVEQIKGDYMPVVNAVNGIRSGVSRFRTALAVALPIINFFRNRRKK